MGCFPTACFRRRPSDNRRRKMKKLNENSEAIDDQKIEEAQIEDPLKISAEIEGKNEEELNSSSRKKVTFASDLLAEGEEETESGKRKQRRNELWAFLCSNDEEEGKNQAEVLSDEKTKGEKQGNDHEAIDIVSDSSQSSLFTYPPNNRFKNCDDECEDTAMNRINLGNEICLTETDEVREREYEEKDGQEETSESLFSLSIDSKKQSSTITTTTTPEIEDKEVSSPFKPCDKAVKKKNQNARDRTEHVDSVLKPIENLNQRKAVRTKTTSSSSFKNQEKENVNNSEEFSIGFVGKENLKMEIAVDTSLSSWLNESEKTPPIKENSPSSVGNSSSKRFLNSSRSFEDRPILGALTPDELKQVSRTSSSPRRSPSFSPDEKPIIGTVGSYWRHTGQAVDEFSGSSYGQI